MPLRLRGVARNDVALLVLAKVATGLKTSSTVGESIQGYTFILLNDEVFPFPTIGVGRHLKPRHRHCLSDHLHNGHLLLDWDLYLNGYIYPVANLTNSGWGSIHMAEGWLWLCLSSHKSRKHIKVRDTSHTLGELRVEEGNNSDGLSNVLYLGLSACSSASS